MQRLLWRSTSIWATMSTMWRPASLQLTRAPHSGTAMRKHSHNIRKSMKEYKYTINGNKYEVVVGDINDNIATLTVNGETYTVEMEKQPEPEKKAAVSTGRQHVVKAATAASDDAPAANKAAVNKANAIKAPLPGVITDVLVAEGDEVKVGDIVVVLEAMKMANNLTAEKAGKVTAVCVKVGESVMEDDALVVIE